MGVHFRTGHTAPHPRPMHNAVPRAFAPAAEPPEALRAAFRDLHGRRLHGYALLLTLGDRTRAARLAADALADGIAHLDDLRHPERAAAWLRSRVVHASRRMRPSEARISDRLQTLTDVGADAAVLAGMAALRHAERAALIAAHVERLDRRDVATIVGRDGQRLDRLLGRARVRYATGFASAVQAHSTPGPVTERVHDVAVRAMG